MTLSKKELYTRLNALEKEVAKAQVKHESVEKALTQMRLEFLRKVLAEAKRRYEFSTVSELAQFMLDNASELRSES
jgi:hypothetical protein